MIFDYLRTSVIHCRRILGSLIVSAGSAPGKVLHQVDKNMTVYRKT